MSNVNSFDKNILSRKESYNLTFYRATHYPEVHDLFTVLWVRQFHIHTSSTCKHRVVHLLTIRWNGIFQPVYRRMTKSKQIWRDYTSIKRLIILYYVNRYYKTLWPDSLRRTLTSDLFSIPPFFCPYNFTNIISLQKVCPHHVRPMTESLRPVEGSLWGSIFWTTSKNIKEIKVDPVPWEPFRDFIFHGKYLSISSCLLDYHISTNPVNRKSLLLGVFWWKEYQNIQIPLGL